MGMNESIVSIPLKTNNTCRLKFPLEFHILLWYRIYLPQISYLCLIEACRYMIYELWQVRRALIIMHQRDEVEYKGERRLILRKA